MFVKVPHKDMPPELVENAMKLCFGGAQQASYYRYDFAYLFSDAENRPEHFILCQEMSNEHIWLAYGGTVPSERGAKSVHSFSSMLDDLKKNYKYVGAQVVNTNFPMIKIYIKNKFKIVGTRQNPQGEIFLEFFKKTEEL